MQTADLIFVSISGLMVYTVAYCNRLSVTRNSPDEIASVNFLYDHIGHVL